MLPKLIGLAGRKRAGKDTAALALIAMGYSPIAFAEPIKAMIAMLAAAGGTDPKDIQRMLEGDLKEVPQDIFGGKTPRHLMQTLGTEWGRRMIVDDLWIRIALADAEKTSGGSVITDVRFPNELEAIRAAGGIIIRIERPERPVGEGEDHSSEILIDTLDVDHVLVNDGLNANHFTGMAREFFEEISNVQ